MVAPQLNLDKKDDVKTPDGSLVKVITVTEPLPVKQEPIYPPTTTRRGCRAGKVLCTLLCALLFIVLTFMLVSYLFYPYGYNGFTCGVIYYDDYGPDYIDMDYYYGSSGSEGRMPYGNDMLFAPRPTGAPLLRYLEEGVSFNAEMTLIHIKTGTDSDAVSVVHDFELHFSAYKVPASEVCYIRPLEMDSTLEPEAFQELLETEAYRNQEFPISREDFVVDPTEVVSGVGEDIQELCEGYNSYYIHSVPADQVQAFWETTRQVFRDHVRRTNPNGRRHGGRGRHHGSSSEEEGPVPGRRHHGSRPSSEEEDRMAQTRGTLHNYIDGIRSFDGQRVIDIRVLQVHSLSEMGFSEADLARLTAFKDNVDIMP